MRAHELSAGFEWRSRPGPFRRVTAAQARAYDEQGFFVLEDAIPRAGLERVIAAIDPFEARVEELLRQAEGGRFFIARAGEITFTTHLVTRSRELRDFVASEPFRALAWDLIGPDVRLYWDQAVYKKPGNPHPFPWHQDNGYAFVEPQQYLTCWIALTDATLDNGCPIVVPGVHRGGTLAHQLTDLGWVCLSDPVETVAVPARAGSIVVFSSLTPHCTGPNTTADVRRSYIVQFAPDGAAVLRRGDAGVERIPANDPERQFPILVGGRPPL